MKKIISLSLISVAFASLSLVGGKNTLKATAITEEEIPSEVDQIPYLADQTLSIGSKKIEIKDASEIDYTGAEGKVLACTEGATNGGAGQGLVLDYTALNIPIEKVASITFRVYALGDTFRIRINNSSITCAQNNTKNQWNLITFGPNDGLQAGRSFADDCGKDGVLGCFEFNVNHQNGMYIDYVKVNLLNDDKIAVLEEMPVVGTVSGVTSMTATNVGYYSNETAIKNNVPTGYEGAVIALSGRDSGGHLGATFDFSKNNIYSSRIKSLTFRMYIAAGQATEVRITNAAGKSWITRTAITSEMTDKWYDFTLKSDGTNFMDGKSFADLCKDNKLGVFNFGVRTGSGKNGPLYIDSVTVECEEIDFSNDFPVIEPISGVSAYPANSMPLTNEEAAGEGVPSGYTGNVLKVFGDSMNMGVTFDFSKKNIPTFSIQSMTFRIYLVKTGNETDSYPEVRITNKAGGSWIMRHLMGKSHLDEWYEITLDRDGTNFYNSATFKSFKNDDNNLGVFEFSVRNTAKTVLYIDSITIVNREADTTAPVITYTGPKQITLTQGVNINLPAIAYDEYEERNVDIYYEWEEGAVIDDVVQVGERKLYIKAKDTANNVASIEISVTVLPKDEEQPVIHVTATTITVKVGTIPQLNVFVSDNRDENLVPTYSWSEGALDERGRLTLGTHVVTITAMDLSNNISIHKVTFIVIE